jgi:hypothetical protein
MTGPKRIFEITALSTRRRESADAERFGAVAGSPATCRFPARKRAAEQASE